MACNMNLSELEALAEMTVTIPHQAVRDCYLRGDASYLKIFWANIVR